MKTFKYTLAIALALALSTAWAGGDPAAQDKPRIYSSETIKVNALVEAVNHETREVTLRHHDGELITFVAEDDVRNLAQVKVGDVINSEYTRSFAIEVYGNAGVAPSTGDFSAMGVAEEGDKPGLTSIDTQVITATVEAIDIEANTFKLKWPDGEVEEFTAQNPENLKKAAVGDLVVITVTEALDVNVEEPPVE